MLDSIGSTSWHHRHLACFQTLARILADEGQRERLVIVIGPGAVCYGLHLLLNDAANENAWRVRKLIGDAARYSDQLLRRIPVLPLITLEPVELTQTIPAPHRLVVIDRSPRILAAAARQLPAADRLLLDIGRQAPPARADVVVAFNVICRLDDPPSGMHNVASAVADGGYLLIDDRSAAACRNELSQFREIAPKIRRRI